MKIFEIINEAKYDFSLADYQAVPYDTEKEKAFRTKFPASNPNRGPQEGKYLNLMLKKMKPATIVDLPREKQMFYPYIEDGTFTLAASDNTNWVITQHGEEWRGPKLLKLFKTLHHAAQTEQPREVLNQIHAKIGMLLGIPKESIRYFINHNQ